MTNIAIEVDNLAAKCGLPRSLWIPIAAADLDSITRFVGPIVDRIENDGRVNAVKIRGAGKPTEVQSVPLWNHKDTERFTDILYPAFQVWVHVDYHGYRSAWTRLGMPDPGEDFLDHVSNRRATRIRRIQKEYLHPYIRLCPVSRAINTNAGHSSGSEGMEVEHMKKLAELPAAECEAAFTKMRSRILYADPMDLTKMLNISPGTQALAGVANFQKWFYPGKASAR